MNIIDIHTHGICGYDTRTKGAEDILKMAEIQRSCGVDMILPTVYPDKIEVMRENMEAIRRAMEIQRSKTSPLHRGDRYRAAGILGVHLEGPFLNPLRCGALNPSSFLEAREYHLERLLDGFEEIVKIITIAPEIDGATRLIRRIADLGIVASMGHSDGTWADAEAGLHAGAKGITHIFNAMRGIHHREPGIAGFGLLCRDIYVEVIADPHHLHQETLELIFRTKNRDRIILVSDSVRETGFQGEGNRGVVDPTGRLLGGSMTIAESSKRMIELGFDEEMIRRCISLNPARYLSI